MSFLELSLYAYEKPAKSAFKIAGVLSDEVLSASKRKAIVKTGLLLLVFSAIGYTFLSGEIVSNNLKRASLTKTYEAESRSLESVRSELIKGDLLLTIDYLNELGYKETKNLNVLKRTSNVAGNSTNSYQ